MSGMRWIIEAFGSLVRRITSGSQAPIEAKVTVELPSFYTRFNVDQDGFKPKWIVIHHSAGADGKTRDWDGIRKYHMSWRYRGEIISEVQYENLKAQGKTEGLEAPWKDVGYHFGIELIGNKIEVMTGRKIGSIGAHAQGFNARSVGICCVDNYDLMAPTNELLFIVSSLCRQLQIEYDIPRDQVIGHRETYPMLNPPEAPKKSCPGKLFDMNELRKRLRD